MNDHRHSAADLDALLDRGLRAAMAAQDRGPSVEPEPDDLLRYEIREVIATGGMGLVMRAWDRQLAREVAIKTIRESLRASPELLHRLEVEASIAGRLQHPGVVPVYERGRLPDGRPFFSMKLIAGTTFRELLAERKDGDLTTLLEVILRVAQTVAYAHLNGVAHRDLKPANIMVGPFGEVLVLDWGLSSDREARIADGSPRLDAPPESGHGALLGTLPYMAPEQARGGGSGGAADVFGLGALLCELMTGNPPFPADDAEEARRLVLAGDLGDAEARIGRCGADSELRDLALACLRPEWKRRPEARDVASTIQSWRERIEGRAEKARLEVATEKACRDLEEKRSREARKRAETEARLRRRALMLASIVVAVTLLGTLVSLRFASRARNNLRVANRAESEAKEARFDLERQTSRLMFEEGFRLAEVGEADLGMHWLLASLRTAPRREEDRRWRELLRRNIAAWSTQLNRLRLDLELPRLVNAVALSPDGRTLVTGELGGAVRRFDARDGRSLGNPLFLDIPRKGWSGVGALAFHPDGAWFLAGGGGIQVQRHGGRVLRIDTKSGQAIGSPIELAGAAHAIAFSPCGELYAVGGGESGRMGGVVSVRRSRDDTEILPIRSIPGDVVDLEFSLDGARVAMAYQGRGDSGGLALLEIESGSCQVIDQRSRCRALAFHPSGQSLAFATAKRQINFLDLRTRTRDREPLACKEPVSDLTRSRQGSGFLVAGEDGVTRFLDPDSPGAPAGAPIRLAQRIAMDRFERVVATVHSRRVRVWDLAPGQALGSSDSFLNRGEAVRRRDVAGDRLAISADERTVLVGLRSGGLARLVDLRSGVSRGRPLEHPYSRIGCVCFSPDSRFCATSCQAKDSAHCLVRVWDVRTAEPVGPWISLPNWVSAMCFSPDGRELLTGSYDARIRSWDPRRGTELRPAWMQPDIVMDLAYSPDGARIAVGVAMDWNHDPQLRLLDAASGALLCPAMRHEHSVALVRFARRGTRLITLSSDGVLMIWNANDGKPVGEPIPGVFCFAFDARGELLFTGGENGELRSWRCSSGEPAVPGTFVAHDAIIALAVSPDGRQAALAFRDGTARLCDLNSFLPLGPRVRSGGASVLALHFPRGKEKWQTIAADGTVGSWPLFSAVEGSVSALRSELEEATAMRWEGGRSPRELGHREWLALKHRGSGEGVPGLWAAIDARDRSGVIPRPRGGDGAAHRPSTARVPDEERLNHQWNEFHRARLQQRWDRALRNCDRLASLAKDDPMPFFWRAEILGAMQRPAAQQEALDRAIAAGLDWSFVEAIADRRAREGRWKRAAELFRFLVGKSSDRSGRALRCWGLALVKAGDEAGHGSLRERMVKLAVAQNQGGASLAAITRICSFGPPAPAVTRPLLEIIVSRLREAKASGADPDPNLLTALTAALSGAEARDNGIDFLTMPPGSSGLDSLDHLLLGLAHHHAGRERAARDFLGHAKKLAVVTTLDFWRHEEYELLEARLEDLLRAPSDS